MLIVWNVAKAKPASKPIPARRAYGLADLLEKIHGTPYLVMDA